MGKSQIVTSQANSILNSIFNKEHYIALSMTTPTATGSNFTEPASATGYRRMQLSQMGTAENGLIKNKDYFLLFEAQSDIGTVSHFGVFAGEDSNTPIYWGELDTPLNITEGKVPVIRVGDLKIGLDREI